MRLIMGQAESLDAAPPMYRPCRRRASISRVLVVTAGSEPATTDAGP